ncbi:MAG: hydrogenase iron-sulfur subunit [Desulfobacteraceae bacterium]|nr:hydrogenase iron-sulfur subunit [Desulfobacteraceae bacterium]
MAGSMRLEYPTNVKIILVPCSGKVDVLHLMRAIQKGADGVYVVGCLEGTCHYNEGNYRARERVEHVRTLMEEVGLEPERVRMYNLSSGEGPTFAAYAKEMTENIKELGPNPLKDKG